VRTLENAWERAKIFRNWEYWVDRIRVSTEKAIGRNLSGIYVFGSLVRGKAVASSDIDILIVAKQAPVLLVERSEIKMRIIEEAGLPLIHPFEIHLVDEKEAETYFRHIRDEFIKIR